MNTLRDQ